MPSYRDADYRDINRITAMEIEVMGELMEEIGGTFPRFDEHTNNETNLISVIEGKCGFAIVAEDEEPYKDKEIVGVILALDSQLESLEDGAHESLVLMNLFVKPEFRRRGIARTLLEELEGKARAAGYPKIRTLVYTPNDKASGLLSGKGYGVICETRNKDL